MVKILTNKTGVKIIDDAESTPGQSRQLSIVKDRIHKLLFQQDVDYVFNQVFGPEFKVVKTEKTNEGTLRYLEFVGNK